MRDSSLQSFLSVSPALRVCQALGRVSEGQESSETCVPMPHVPGETKAAGDDVT